jgi:hypothetical protein
MARFILLVLLVVAGGLVVALFLDHRGRRDAVVDRLRWAFLHGRPLAGYSRATALADFVHPGGLRFRAPASWTVDMTDPGAEAPAATPGAGRRLSVEVLRLESAGAAGTESVVDALESLAANGERAVEVLPNGNVLMKTLEAASSEAGALACYAWSLGAAAPPRGVRIATFRLRLPVAAAGDVIAQSDLAIVDREVREAAFADGPSAPAAAT